MPPARGGESGVGTANKQDERERGRGRVKGASLCRGARKQGERDGDGGMLSLARERKRTAHRTRSKKEGADGRRRAPVRVRVYACGTGDKPSVCLERCLRGEWKVGPEVASTTGVQSCGRCDRDPNLRTPCRPERSADKVLSVNGGRRRRRERCRARERAVRPL